MAINEQSKTRSITGWTKNSRRRPQVVITVGNTAGIRQFRKGERFRKTNPFEIRYVAVPAWVGTKKRNDSWRAKEEKVRESFMHGEVSRDI